jgi:hypothetical protein
MTKLESGQLGSHKYEFEFLIPGAFAAVVIQFGEAEAVRLIWWHHPEWAGMPLQEIEHFEDSDEVCDALNDALQAWVGTFPLVKAEVAR